MYYTSLDSCLDFPFLNSSMQISNVPLWIFVSEKKKKTLGTRNFYQTQLVHCTIWSLGQQALKCLIQHVNYLLFIISLCSYILYHNNKVLIIICLTMWSLVM